MTGWSRVGHELGDFAFAFERSYVAIRSCIVPNGDDPPDVSRVVLLGNPREYASIRHGSDAREQRLDAVTGARHAPSHDERASRRGGSTRREGSPPSELRRRLSLSRSLGAFEAASSGALYLAVIATKRDEGCVDCYETAAETALQTGDVERAVRLQEIAVNVASEFDDEMPRMLRTLERYRSKLAQTPRMP